VAIVIVSVLSACGSRAALDAHAPISGCDRLDSQLSQLVASKERDSFAASAGLELDGDRVRVILELEPGTALPSGHRVDVEATYATDVLARVPVDELCAVAREGSVRAVRPARRGTPEAPRP
jgi:hypothetical protein